MIKREDEYSYFSGDLAREVDMSIEGLRYYEKVGITRGKRAENGYRLYNPQEVCLLRLIRIFTRYGMPLKNAIEQIGKDMDLNQTFHGINQLEIDLDTKIKELTQTKEALLKHKRNLEEIPQNNIWFETLPPSIYFCYNTGLFLKSDEQLKQLYEKWIKLMPIAFPTPRLLMNLYGDEDAFISGGFLIEKSLLNDPTLINEQYCQEYPELNCLSFILQQENPRGVTLSQKQIETINHYLIENQLSLCNDIFFKSVFPYKNNEEMAYYYQILIPIIHRN